MITTIRIAGVDYPITYTPTPELENVLAFIDFNRSIIQVNSNYPKETQQLSLLHEIVHGVNYAYSVGMTEEQVERFSRGFYAMVKDNPNYEIFEGS